MKATRSGSLLTLCLLLSSCGGLGNRDQCVFSESPNTELLRSSAQHLEIIDAETGEVASYDPQGYPVLEGGQPLALWAEFETPTLVEICVTEDNGNESVRHRSEVEFSEEVFTQPLGKYDIGSYLLHISMNDTLVATMHFVVR